MQRRHRQAHATLWTLIAVALPIAIAVIFVSIPKLPSDARAVRLDADAGNRIGEGDK